MLLLVALATAAAAFVKGAIGFGFPPVATPLLSLWLDVKAAVLVLIVPNIVMDGLQLLRGGAPLPIVRRMLPVVVFGALGMVVGTHLLTVLSSRTVMLVLASFVLLYVPLQLTRLAPRLPATSEWWAAPVAGLVSGVVGGITNVPGTPLVIYFQALGLSKQDFVRAVAFTFVVSKIVQLAAVTWYGLMTAALMVGSLLLTAAALAGFAVGLRVQDRLEPRTFNRAVLGFLSLLGVWLLVRNLPWKGD
jgi:uncharacterized membrane protein YfcA